MDISVKQQERNGADDRLRPVVAVVLGAFVVAAVVVLALFFRGGGAVLGGRSQQASPLAPSGPAEVVLRTLRLAGYERAVVGDSRAGVVVRLDVPDMASAADAELSWQTAVAAASRAYPGARGYTVQLFARQQPLLEVRFEGAPTRAAVSAGDPRALRRAARFVYLTEAPR